MIHKFYICIYLTCTQATVVLKGHLEDSRSFVKDPPHLNLNHSFQVIQLSPPNKTA